MNVSLRCLVLICFLLFVYCNIDCCYARDLDQQPFIIQQEPEDSILEQAPEQTFNRIDYGDSEKWRAKTPLELRGKVDKKTLNKTLTPLVFETLPLGSIKPRGWFKEQLQLMTNGLPGRMHEFYRLVKDATWLGGNEEYSALNEAWPYYINGLIPLAYGLNDRRLKKRVKREVARVLQLQHEDGWLGPEMNLSQRNLWARYPLFLGLAQLTDVVGSKEQTLILDSMHKFVNLMQNMLKDDYQGYVWKQGDKFNDQWGRSRAADMILALQWLYEKHPNGNEGTIHECMIMLYEMSYDWSYWFREDVFVKHDLDTLPANTTDALFPFIHGVNAGQGLKYGAVVRRLLHDDKLLESVRRGVDWTFKYHGTASGAIIADEKLSGLSPVRGTELCSVVETMFSLGYLYQATGDSSFADRMELTAFNALPTMVMPRWWAHQYVAQTNQPFSHKLANSPFANVGVDGQTFGLEPHYPCCTVQFSQGYPKLLSASWVRTGENGVAHGILVPSEVKTVLVAHHKHGKPMKNKIHIKCKTNYPFAYFLTYDVHASHPFNFSFRVPSWTNTTHPWTFVYSATKSDPYPGQQKLHPDSHSGLHSIALPRGHSFVEVSLHPKGKGVQVHVRPNNTISVSHGPLVFALSPHHHSVPHRPSNYPGDLAPPQSNDWEIRPRHGDIWNVAIDPNTLRFYEYDNRYDENLPNPIWDGFAPPVSVSALACEIDWKLSSINSSNMENYKGGGYAERPPLPGLRNCTGRAFPVELKPYGAAKIRIAEFPVVDLSPGSDDLHDPFEEKKSSKAVDGEKTEL